MEAEICHKGHFVSLDFDTGRNVGRDIGQGINKIFISCLPLHLEFLR